MARIYSCIVTVPVRASKVAPRSSRARFRLLERHGGSAFLMPGGTPSRPNVPAFPVVDKSGCFVCSMGRAAYTRIGQGINKRGYPRAYKDRLKAARCRLIRTALKHSDGSDKANACNWAIAAARRYL